MSVAVEVVIGVAVLALLMFRQLQTRPVRDSGVRIMLILGVIGIVETVQYLDKHHGGPTIYAAILGSLVLAGIFGVLRALTTRVWQQDGQVWRKGNWVSASLWVVAVAAHLGYDALLLHGKGDSDLGNVTLLLYLAISLGVQRILVAQRATRLQPGGPAPATGYGQFS
jgi:hypothetical protein